MQVTITQYYVYIYSTVLLKSSAGQGKLITEKLGQKHAHLSWLGRNY